MAMVTAVEAMVRGEHLLWCAPTFDQATIGWNEMYKAIGDVAVFHRSRMEVDIPGLGSTTFRSLDNPDNARGHTAYGVVMDEAPLIAEAAWYEVVRPTLSDTNGWALLMGTPKGRNWFWREFMAAKDQADAAAWSVPTLGVAIEEGRLVRKPHPMENPDFPFSEAQAMYAMMPERTFRQEFLAEFLEDGGGVFRMVTQAATAKELLRGQGGRSYVIGVDWGKYEDWSVFVVMDASQRAMVHIDRLNQIDYHIQMNRLTALVERFSPVQAIIAEANAMGEPIIEQLLRRQLPVRRFVTTTATKAEMIESLQLAFEQGTVRILNDPTLIAELQAYEQERLPSGRISYHAPEGMHDDCVMALGMAWSALATSHVKPGVVKYA